MPQTTCKNPGIFASFAEGAKNGWHIAINSMLPGVMFAFMLIMFLELTGLMLPIKVAFSPIMGVFGLPGKAVTAVFLGFLSTSGGLGAAIGLFADNELNSGHMAILTAGVMSNGAMIQYMSRVLGTAAVKAGHYPVMLGITAFNCFLSMLVMRFLLLFVY